MCLRKQNRHFLGIAAKYVIKMEIAAIGKKTVALLRQIEGFIR